MLAASSVTSNATMGCQIRVHITAVGYRRVFFEDCEPLISKWFDNVGAFTHFTDRCLDVDPVSMALALAGADCTVCGNGDVGTHKECDDGTANADTPGAACRINCGLPSCGDHVVDPGEACDDGLANCDDCDCHIDCTQPSPDMIPELMAYWDSGACGHHGDD